MTTDLSLRPFTAADARRVARWFADAPQATAFAGTGAAWPLDPDELMSRVGRQDLEVLSAVGQGDPGTEATLVGHVEIVRVDPPRGRLARIAVAPELRGQGLARPMVALAMERAARSGITELALFVVPGNEPAFRTYAGLGFREDLPDPAHPEYVRLTNRR